MPRTVSWCAVLLAAALVSGTRAEEPKKDAPAKPPTFKAPKGWDAVEGTKTDIVQVAARFKSGEGEKAVAVVVLGSAGEGGGVLANVNRWRAQVGLEALDPKAAMEAVQEIKVDGLPAFRIDATGPKVAGNPAPRVVGVIVKSSDTTWFIKMTGADAPVGDQKAAFDEFVKSIRFAK